MAEEDTIFDPSMKKKKKKKKTPFDLDAALNEVEDLTEKHNEANISEDVGKENEPEVFEDKDIDDLNLESFGKKKKKKKKGFAFNMDELESSLTDIKAENKDLTDKKQVSVEEPEEDVALDLDFFKTEKKKKKKKYDIDDILADEELKMEQESGDTPHVGWLGSDRDYTYQELLGRIFEIIRERNPDMVSGERKKLIMRPPQVVRVGTKKTSFVNFTDICRILHRQPKHVLNFLLTELGTSGSVDGTNQLIIKGKFQQAQIQNVLRRYIKEYVTCHTCWSADTILQKDTRLFFISCEKCGSRCSVATIKSGFQAVTSKRERIRAKNV